MESLIIVLKPGVRTEPTGTPQMPAETRAGRMTDQRFVQIRFHGNLRECSSEVRRER